MTNDHVVVWRWRRRYKEIRGKYGIYEQMMGLVTVLGGKEVFALV